MPGKEFGESNTTRENDHNLRTVGEQIPPPTPPIVVASPPSISTVDIKALAARRAQEFSRAKQQQAQAERAYWQKQALAATEDDAALLDEDDLASPTPSAKMC